RTVAGSRTSDLRRAEPEEFAAPVAVPERAALAPRLRLPQQALRFPPVLAPPFRFPPVLARPFRFPRFPSWWLRLLRFLKFLFRRLPFPQSLFPALAQLQRIPAAARLRRLPTRKTRPTRCLHSTLSPALFAAHGWHWGEMLLRCLSLRLRPRSARFRRMRPGA